jgi:uncharacterized protein YecT (DUF1311 family)
LTGIAFLLIAGLANEASASPTYSMPPPALVGTWDVVRVAVDGEDQLHWQFHPDDPRLLGRTLIVTPERVQFEHGRRLGCKQSSWAPRRTTWGVLFAKGFPRPAMGGRSPTPLPGDFGVTVAKKEPVMAYSLCAESTGNSFAAGHWVALMGEELALHYDNQVLVLLRQRPVTAKPVASFSCAKAATPTEKAICERFELASLDRSVAQAFREALERRPEKQASLRQNEKEWLSKRDACQARVDCLYDELWARVDELTQE